MPLPVGGAPPVLVVGGDNDYSVDKEGLQETADHYGVQPTILPGLAHDLMLVQAFSYYVWLHNLRHAGLLYVWLHCRRPALKPSLSAS